MKLIIDDNIVIFLGKTYLQNIDITDRSIIEKRLLKIINQIKNKFNIELNGYYNVYIYKDNNYGFIIKMSKEELEYLEYFNNQIELNIEVIEDDFIYKVEDIFNLNKNLLKKFIVYKNNDLFYLKAKENLTNIELGIILENSEIIYGKQAKKIIIKSKIVKV